MKTFSLIFVFCFFSCLAFASDTIPPTGSISINNGAAYTNSNKVTLSLSATDTESALSQMCFSNDAKKWSSPETYALTKSYTLTSKAGVKQVYVKFKDTAGNWSSAYSDSIIFDNKGPTGSVKINNGAKSTDTVNVTLNLLATDVASGIAQMQFSNDNSTWSTPESFAATKSWILASGIGSKKVYAKFKDNAGNWSKKAASAKIKLLSQQQGPTINSILPQDGTTFLAGAQITIQVDASSTNLPLQYRYSIGGSVKQTWVPSNTYNWQTTTSDTSGAISIQCEVKDSQSQVSSKTITISIINPTIQQILQKVADNYSKIQDYKGDMEVSSTLNGNLFGQVQYCRYFYKAPNKEKTESFSNTTRASKTDIIIIDNTNMHLINPIKAIKQTIDLLTDKGITETEYKQGDIYYNQATFLANNNLLRNDAYSDLNNKVIYIEATPKSATKMYDKLGFLIDYNKGILIKLRIYKYDDTGTLALIQETNTVESIQFSNGAWLPTKMTKIPSVGTDVFISTAIYSNLEINVGLIDADFDPTKQ